MRKEFQQQLQELDEFYRTEIEKLRGELREQSHRVESYGDGLTRLCALTENDSTGSNVVLPSDTVLVPPDDNISPTVAAVTAYTWIEEEGSVRYNDTLFERPIYIQVDRDRDDYWHYLVDELLLSRVDVVLLSSRSCWQREPTGDDAIDDASPANMCPRVLRKFVKAVQVANATNVMRLAMFDDTAAYRHVAGVSRLDLSNQTNWEYFWDNNIKIWFDTIPSELWYLMNGSPVIVFWDLRDKFFSNQQGNASALLVWLSNKFQERYQARPAFVVHRTWFEYDSTITREHAVGKHGWFTPMHDDMSSIYSIETFDGSLWGATAPGFREEGTLPGCGVDCREVTRRDGLALKNALTEITTPSNSKLVLLEGWTDLLESAGFYRSNDWLYPNQYIKHCS